MYKLSTNVIYDKDISSNKKYLIDIDNGMLFQLNDTASIIIEKIIEGNNIQDCIQFLRECIDKEIDIESIKNDVEVYINQLLERGFIIEEDNR